MTSNMILLHDVNAWVEKSGSQITGTFGTFGESWNLRTTCSYCICLNHQRLSQQSILTLQLACCNSTLALLQLAVTHGKVTWAHPQEFPSPTDGEGEKNCSVLCDNPFEKELCNTSGVGIIMSPQKNITTGGGLISICKALRVIKKNTSPLLRDMNLAKPMSCDNIRGQMSDGSMKGGRFYHDIRKQVRSGRHESTTVLTLNPVIRC